MEADDDNGGCGGDINHLRNGGTGKKKKEVVKDLKKST